MMRNGIEAGFLNKETKSMGMCHVMGLVASVHGEVTCRNWKKGYVAGGK